MNQNSSDSRTSRVGIKLPPRLWLVLVLGLLGLAWYQSRFPDVATPSGVPAVADPDKPADSVRPEKTTDDENIDQTADWKAREPGTTSRENSSLKPNSSPARTAKESNNYATEIRAGPAVSTKIANQTIRNFGRVVYKGTIDLTPTLDRIERGERNAHRNDGSTFGNREGRLPRKPSGYYTEYVHPTRGIDGPGPQRVILGKAGDVWYTPDHYESFQKIR